MSSFQRDKKADPDAMSPEVLELAAEVIALVLRILKNIFFRFSPQAVIPESPAVAKIPEVTNVGKNDFVVANVVYSTLIRNRTVHFLLYAKQGKIRIWSRINGFKEELEFTSAMAVEKKVPFLIDSAVAWVEQVGFQKAKQATPSSAPIVSNPVAPKPATTEKPAPTQQKLSSPPFEDKSTAPVKVDPAKKAKRPFEGRIISYGAVEMPARDDKKAYKTFALVMNHDRIGERKFIGDHLQELIAELDLKAGQKIRLHELGKTYFHVEVNGKMEERNRNGYAIEII